MADRSQIHEVGTETLASAIARYRETSKWLLTVLGALGGALLTSLSLASLGDARNRSAAICGFVLALFAVVCSIAMVTAVLGATKPTIMDVKGSSRLLKLFAKTTENEPSPHLLGFDCFEDVYQRYLLLGKDYISAWSDYDEAQETGAVSKANAAKTRARQVEHQLVPVNRAITYIKDYSFYWRTRTWFLRAVGTIGAASVVATFGLVLFSVNSTAPAEAADSNKAPVRSVVATHLSITAERAAEIVDGVGENCLVKNEASGRYETRVLLVGLGDELWAVIEPTEDCIGTELKYDSEWARIVNR